MIPSGTIITPELWTLWLAERTHTIGASDCAAALGISPWDTPLSLYVEKIKATSGDPENRHTSRGKKRESLILDEYEEWCLENGEGEVRLDRQVYVWQPDSPWLTATLDGWRHDGVVVEAKSVGWRSANHWGDPNEGDQAPAHILCQAHHQMAASGAKLVHIVADIGNEPVVVYRVPRYEDMIAIIKAGLREFMDRVEQRRPPEPSARADVQVLKRLYPKAEGETWASVEMEANVDMYAELGGCIKDWEERRDILKAEILAAMGDAAKAKLSDGRTVKRSVSQIAERTQVVKAHTQVRLTISKGRD